MAINGAQIQLIERADPNASEQNIITIDGSDRKITLQIKVDGVWKKIASNSFTNAYHQKIAAHCHEIYLTATHETELPKTLTVYFEQKNLSESLTSSTLGGILPSFKEEVVDLTFNKLEYKTADSDELKVVEEKTHEFDIGKVNQIASSMTELSKAIFGNREHFLEKTKKIKKQPARHVTQPLDSAISDAGSAENRCASLSLAKRELARLTPAQIVKKYELPNDLLLSLTNEPNSEEKIRLLSNALIEKAARNITENRAFRDPYIRLQNEPCLAAIERALTEHQLSHAEFVIPATAEEKIAAYVSLMRQPNFMLDLPFFLALEQPFIILRKNNQGSFMIDVISQRYHISDTIENCDLDDVNIVYYNGTNHYQSVVLSEDAQKGAMRELLRKNINDQIEGFIPRLRVAAVTPEARIQESDDMTDLFFFYPRAKRELIDRFKREYPSKALQIENLMEYTLTLAAQLREVIHNILIPTIEDLEIPTVPVEWTLSQIQTLILDTKENRAENSAQFESLVKYVLEHSPIDGKSKIISMLKRESEKDMLIWLYDDRFIFEAKTTFLNTDTFLA